MVCRHGSCTSGDVRICVDLKGLNERVLRRTHLSPKVDVTFAQFSGASVSSKLDGIAASGKSLCQKIPSC